MNSVNFALVSESFLKQDLHKYDYIATHSQTHIDMLLMPK